MKRKLIGIFLFLTLGLVFSVSSASSQKNRSSLVSKQESLGSPVLAASVFGEINAARANPAQFAGYLRDYRTRYHGQTFSLFSGVSATSDEGTAAIDEAISFFDAAPAAGLLKRENGLDQAADYLLRDLLVDPSLGHTARDGSTFVERMRKYGQAKMPLGENLAYGRDNAREVVFQWLIDDGVASRLHRKNLMNAKFNHIGIACGTAHNGTTICVTEYAASFTPAGQPAVVEY